VALRKVLILFLQEMTAVDVLGLDADDFVWRLAS
jgi:hypothetical protein